MKRDARQRAITNPKLRELITHVLRLYRQSGPTLHNENLKHVRRMAKVIRDSAVELRALGCDPEILYTALLISDVGKEPHLIKKYLSDYGGNEFKAFLDHSRISMRELNATRKKLNILDTTWRKILSSIIGHDGPSIFGSWWKSEYEREFGKKYAALHSREAVIHCYLDRIDQGGIFKGRNGQLNGGLRKISYDIFTKGKVRGNLAGVIQEVFGAARMGTCNQIDHLDQVVKPEFFGNKPLPSFLREMKKKFDEAEKFFEHVLMDETRETGRVRVILSDGESIEVNNLDEFWRTLSRVTPKSPLAAQCRIS
jgi:hypothetical protein